MSPVGAGAARGPEAGGGFPGAGAASFFTNADFRRGWALGLAQRTIGRPLESSLGAFSLEPSEADKRAAAPLAGEVRRTAAPAPDRGDLAGAGMTATREEAPELSRTTVPAVEVEVGVLDRRPAGGVVGLSRLGPVGVTRLMTVTAAGLPRWAAPAVGVPRRTEEGVGGPSPPRGDTDLRRARSIPRERAARFPGAWGDTDRRLISADPRVGGSGRAMNPSAPLGELLPDLGVPAVLPPPPTASRDGGTATSGR